MLSNQLSKSNIVFFMKDYSFTQKIIIIHKICV